MAALLSDQDDERARRRGTPGGPPCPIPCPGTLHALDIVQRDERGRVLGGLRVLALVTA
jgi:hypothetical protein